MPKTKRYLHGVEMQFVNSALFFPCQTETNKMNINNHHKSQTQHTETYTLSPTMEATIKETQNVLNVWLLLFPIKALTAVQQTYKLFCMREKKTIFHKNPI